MKVRSLVTTTQETCSEAGAAVNPPTIIVIAAAVVQNPLAGKDKVDDLTELVELGRESSELLVQQALRALAAMGVQPDAVRGYGKGAIVGVDGDREHTAAVLHPRFGAPVRVHRSPCRSVTKMIAGSSMTWIRWICLSPMPRMQMKWSLPWCLAPVVDQTPA